MNNELPLSHLDLVLILQIQQEIQIAAQKFIINLEREETNLNPEESIRLFNVERKREGAARERARLITAMNKSGLYGFSPMFFKQKKAAISTFFYPI